MAFAYEWQGPYYALLAFAFRLRHWTTSTMGRRYLSVAISGRHYYNGTPLPISRPVSVPMAVSPTSSTCAVKDGDDGTEERPAKRIR
jgi:hypothetical protein